MHFVGARGTGWAQFLSVWVKAKSVTIQTKFCVFADDPQTALQYHQEYNPPVHGSYTGMNKQEKVVSVMDPSNDREQVQQR